MASHAGEQHIYGVEDTDAGQRKDAHMIRTSPYVDQSLEITTELQEVFTTLKNLGELAMAIYI